MRKFLVFCIFATQALLADYAISITGELKYKPDFKHFDYVNPDAPKGGEFISHINGTYDSLNQYLLNVVPAAGLGYVYDTLTQSSDDEPFARYGLIADDMKVAKDKFSVTFHINPKARFHDGTKVTASDIKFSYETIVEKNILYKRYFSDVKSVDVLDESRVRFNFKVNDNNELPMILGEVPAIPMHVYMKNGKNTFGEDSLARPIGSGPYKVDSFDLGKRITFVRDKNYWAKDLPVAVGFYNFDKIKFEYYKDETVALKAFLKGDYDYRFESTSKVWARDYTGHAIDDGLIKREVIEQGYPSGMSGIFFNTRRDLFKDWRVRRALLYAFNAEWVNKNLYYSQYTRIQSFFDHSEFAMNKLPSKEDLKIYEPYKKQILERYPDFFTRSYALPRTDGGSGLEKITEII
ncbi:MAG: extracellular solute-binding protein [Helicobacter sp.]|nr:extracellular solute-binding protein [Helicobacter sp.]